MAKTTYYEIDPISSTAVELNDATNTPNTEVLSCTVNAKPNVTTVSLVGCDNPTQSVAGTTATITIVLEIQSASMDSVYTKIDDLFTACQGDQSIPVNLLTKDRFHFAVALDGASKYGYIRCKLTQFQPDWRAQYTYSGTNYRLTQEPYLTQILIVAETGYPTLRLIT